MQISEHDWKIFRNKIPDWQERYMERLATDYITLLQISPFPIFYDKINVTVQS